MFNLTPYHRNKGSLSLFDTDAFFDRFFNDAFLPSLQMNTSQMKVEIRENEKEYIIEADLPGTKKEEIGIALEDDLLTITVTKNEQVDEQNERYIRKERKYGSTSRSFSVANVKEEDIAAKFENGVLMLSLPKKTPESAKNRRIEIN